ncbi:MAG: glycosyltransferase [Candidatus Parvarchaeota archaeon]
MNDPILNDNGMKVNSSKSKVGFAKSECISIVIPTKNRLSDLKRCLNALMGQLKMDDELIIIDNGSTDGTNEYISGLVSTCRNIRIIHNDTSNLPHLFNLGWRSASCQLIGFLNDDTEPFPSWVSDIKYWFSRLPSAAVLGGPTYDQNNRITSNLYRTNHILLRLYDKIVAGGKLNQVGVLTDYGVYSLGVIRPKDPLRVSGLTITNMAVRRGALQEVDGFNEVFSFSNYDGFFFLEIEKRGAEMFLIPGAEVKHFPNPNGLTRSAYHLSIDYAIFYSLLKPKNLKNKIRLKLNIISYFLLWVYLSLKGKAVFREVLSGYLLGMRKAKRYKRRSR